jgi:hypothetical protein
MNFKSLINDICCDGRIKDGIFDFQNQEHVFVLQEYLEKTGCDVNYVVEKTANLFEAGRFPERQAYNKDGILVTFPSKEYKDRAVNKGTHFAENPKKSDANIFTTPPPDVKAGGSEDSIYNADVEKPKDVSIDQELSDKNVDTQKDDRTPNEKQVDSKGVEAILIGQTPLVNYSVDEAKKCGFYNKGFNWYNTEGEFIGEQIFDEKNGKTIIRPLIGEVRTKEDNVNVDILRKLGLERFTDEEIINNANQNVSSVTISPGSNNKYGLTTPINYIGLENILKKEGKLVITYSGTVKKIRTDSNIRIAEWSNAKSISSADFKRAIMVYQFYINNNDKVELIAKQARGIGYEQMQVQNLNNWFIKNEINVPMRLYISDELHEFRDTGVSVNGAEKLRGTGKADLALTENSTAKFWISYKHGNYWSEEGSAKTLSSVPFQQYGSIKTLHSKLGSEKGKWAEIISNFLSKLTETLPSDSKTTIRAGYSLDVDNKQRKVKTNDTNVLFSQQEVNLISANASSVQTVFKNNPGLDKELYFLPRGFSVWMDMLDGTEESKQIAGMTIYGLDFKLNSTNYGPENVQCLIQTNEILDVEFHTNQEEDPNGIKISTDKRGHILFNPNLPAPKNAEDPILQYRPVIYARFTEEENFSYTKKGKVILLLGCRILVMPYGKLSGTSIAL